MVHRFNESYSIVISNPKSNTMKKMCFRLCYLCILAVALVSCETEDSINVNQDRIYGAYELFYNQNEDKTIAKAIFTFGTRTGTRLTLSEGSTIQFNGQSMPYEELTGAYITEVAGYQNSGTFVFEDLDTGVFTNTIQLNPIDFEETMPATLDQSQSYQFGWIGDAVETDRSAVSMTVLPNNLDQTEIFVQTTSGAESIVLSTDRLSKIDPQPGSLILERGTESEVAQGSSAGGVLIARYRTANKSIVIE